MERVYTAGTVRKILFNALIDPSCAVAGNHLYGCTLLWSKAFQKPGEDVLPVLVAGPDNGVCVVIHNDGDVLMPLAVADFVDTDVDKVIQPFRWVGLYVVPAE